MRKLAAVAVFLVSLTLAGAERRLVIMDQDGNGPADTNQFSMLVLLQSPNVDVLGITIVTGDGSRDDEVLHTLRMLELTKHKVPVVAGAAAPLLRTQEETRIDESLHGTVRWKGAWRDDYSGAALPEGKPETRALAEDAAHFLVRQVRGHPGEITIIACGPLTNIALAIAIEPRFASMTRGLVVMGSSLNSDVERPRHEFNFWFDPEAARKVLRGDWPRIDVTTVDVSIKGMFTKEMLDEISRSESATAKYIRQFTTELSYQWDEIAVCAWLDPTIITKTIDLYMDVDLSHGPSYGDTLTRPDTAKPATGVRLVHAQLDLDLPKFRKMFVALMTKE